METAVCRNQVLQTAVLLEAVIIGNPEPFVRLGSVAQTGNGQSRVV